MAIENDAKGEATEENCECEAIVQLCAWCTQVINIPSLTSAYFKRLFNNTIALLDTHFGRTISRTKGDLMPELTKTFFEKILRDSERQDLQVSLHLDLGLDDEMEN